MWTCPNCNRTFTRQNQNHYCGSPPETVDSYIAAQPESMHPYLYAVRDTLRDALPGVQEKISWSMPTYWEEHNIIQFSGAKAHIGLYPGPEAVAHFRERLTGFSTSKGTIRLPWNKPLPLELIAEIAQWCRETGNHP